MVAAARASLLTAQAVLHLHPATDGQPPGPRSSWCRL
jgi:hypothetical protein